MKALSVFCDEAGQQDMSEGYYLLTLVLHDQSDDLDDTFSNYRMHIRQHGLPLIPFHMKDLIHGHGAYEGLDQKVRKKLLIHFNIFMQKIPVRYKSFVYSKYDIQSEESLKARMKKDVVDFIFEHLSWLQSYDIIPIYYDDGQRVVTGALRSAFDYMLPNGAVKYRHVRYSDRYLSQAADYFCSIEMAATKYSAASESSSYRKFFGLKGDFKKNYLKQARRKALA